MTEEETSDNNNNPNQEVIPPTSIPIDTSITDNKQPETPQKPRKKKKIISVRVIQEKTNGQRIANWIAGIATAVSLGVGIVTLFLFNETKKANETTSKSLSHQIYKDSLDSVSAFRKDKADANNRIIEKKRADSVFEYQKRSFSAQIDAFKESQRQFNIINKSYIQVEQFDTIKINGYNQIYKFAITNIGNQPSKIINGSFYFALGDKGRSYKELKDAIVTQHLVPYIEGDNGYVIKDSPIAKTIKSDIYISNEEYKLIKSGVIKIYVIGNYKYKDLVTEKFYIYKFAAVYNFNPGMGYKMLYNENTEDN